MIEIIKDIIIWFIFFLAGMLTMWLHNWQKKLESHKKGLDKWLAERKL